MVNRFKIIFSGQTLPGQDAQQVAQKLCETLNLPNEQIHAWFNGRQTFSKDQLDFVTANRYRRKFEMAGALCHVLPMLVCPHCGHRQRKAAQCVKCHQSLLLTDETLDSPEDSDEKQLRQRAVQSLSLGLMLLLGSFILDSYLLQLGLDWYWLYALTVPLFALGCAQFARYKGYSIWLGGLLGLTLSFGLSVLILLSDKRHPHVKLDQKATLGAMLLIFISLVWVWRTGAESADISQFEQQAQALQQQLLTATGTPDEILAPARKHVLQGLAFWEQHSLRPHQFEAFGDAIFAPLSQSLIRLQAIQFEQAHQQGEIENAFQKAALEPVHRELRDLIESKVKAQARNAGLQKSYQDWLMMYYNPEQENFMRQLSNVFIALIQSTQMFYAIHQKMPETLAELKASTPVQGLNAELIDIELTTPFQYTLHVSQKNKELAGKTVVLGAYFYTVKRLHRQKRMRLERIGGDLAGKYLLNMSVFRDWRLLDV